MAELSPMFAEMQKRLEKPSCFGEYEKSQKCGTCWFWPKCKDGKAPAKKGRPSKQPELVKGNDK